MAGRHSKQGRFVPQRRRAIATVELDVLPAPLIARQARYCRLCATVPAQRSWDSGR
jgi:hypothetical protein